LKTATTIKDNITHWVYDIASMRIFVKPITIYLETLVGVFYTKFDIRVVSRIQRTVIRFCNQLGVELYLHIHWLFTNLIQCWAAAGLPFCTLLY